MANNLRLPATTFIGKVCLAVASLDPSVDFYASILGLSLIAMADCTAILGVPGDERRPNGHSGTKQPLVHLVELPGGRRVRGTTSLYQVAFRVPSRLALGRILQRLLGRCQLDGASDHQVSEALYLSDPDGNGLEIYWDRPRTDWSFTSEGALCMTADPLDLESLLAETAEDNPNPAFTPIPLPAQAGSPEPFSAPGAGLPPGTRIGHIHLHVANLRLAEDFYAGLLGFDVTQRYGPGAVFVVAGDYHHHLGLNTWIGEGAPPPPADALELRWFSLRLPGRDSLDDLAKRLQRTGQYLELYPEGCLVRDPSRNGILLTC